MQMESDGRSYYLDHAERVNIPALKQILHTLADDELKHYNLFKALRDGAAAEYKSADATKILMSTKNVFQRLRETESAEAMGSDPRTVWQKAQDVEKESEEYYRKEAAKLSDPNQKSILNKIADEEHKHWVALQHVIEFLDRPQAFLENAEWNALDE
jgi:rubrerythrin